MDFDDLTQNLLVTFLRNSTNLVRLKHDLNARASFSVDDHANATTGEWYRSVARPATTIPYSVPLHSQMQMWPIAMLPTPEPLQSDQAQVNEESDHNIMFDIIIQNRGQSQILPNQTWESPGGNDYDNDSTVSRLFLWDFIIGIVLAIVTLATVIGNGLVIAAILRERHLRSVGNYLVFSLAVADMMVACLVMPLGALYAVTGDWTLGAAFCDLWTVADVLCCTASILHLLAIAVDRYWAVTNVDYIHQRRNSNRIGLMIFLIWFASIVISLAPVFGWRDPDFPVRIAQRECLISQDVTYQIFATCASFYVPLLLILLLYWRIYQVARKRIRRKPGNKVTLVTMKTASNASNANVETKVMKGVSNVSKTSRKLAKYSAAKYLQKQGASRLNSDMMSLDTDQCLHASVDSLASTGSANPNGCATRDAAFEHKPAGDLPSPPTSTGPNLRKKMSIISTARTTTTSLITTNCSDHSCSTFAPTSSQSIGFLSCSRVDPVGYSIIAEEASSSSSTAQPLTSIRCVENEPDVNEHSPLPLSSNANCANGSVVVTWSEHVDHFSKSNHQCPHQCTEPLSVLHRQQLGSEPGEKRDQQQQWSINSSLPDEQDKMGVPCQPSRTMSLSVGSNDANQSFQCGQVSLAMSHRYRAQSNESIAKKKALAMGDQCVVCCGDSVGAAANRINNDPSVIVTDSDRLASDSNLIAIDTNYCRNVDQIENGHSSPSEKTAIGFGNDSPGDAASAVPLTSEDSLLGDRSVQVLKCNHSSNGGPTSQAINSSSRPQPPVSPQTTAIASRVEPSNKPSTELANDRTVVHSLQLKEDSSSSTASASTSHKTPHTHNHTHSHKERHRRPLKPSSQRSNPSATAQSKLHHKESVESKRERKAAKTLAIITGVFVICWLPFFINALLSPLSKTYQDLVPNFLTEIFLWLGYINSCVNPIIYTIFSPDFRTAFKKMLLGKKTVRSPKGWSKGMSRV